MHNTRYVAVLAALALVTQMSMYSSPAAATTQPCDEGGRFVPWGAEFEEEVEYLAGIELCAFPDGGATVANNTDQAWYFSGPGVVTMWTGPDRIGAMHRLSESREPWAQYMLPGETVLLSRWQEMHWYLDKPRTTRWMLFEQVIDATEEKSLAAAGYLIALKSKSASALWSCTAGAYTFGKTLSGTEITGQDLIDASLITGTSARSCQKSWNALAKKVRVSQRLPNLSAVTTFAERASALNDWTKVLRALAQLR